jgi:hypothetical protein
MPRKPAKSVPGTERFRDERRNGGPRMHEREWHDHEEPHELERVETSLAADAVIEAESAGERTGMHRRATGTRPELTHEHRKRTVPPSKGRKQTRSASKAGKGGAPG